MSFVSEYIQQVIETWLDIAPWLMLGLIVAGLIHVFLPAARITRWLGGSGPGPVYKAALLGTPLPLCSCSVLPAAVALRRQGASRGATVSFLVSTPENGADSLAVSYVLLGPVMTIARLVGALISAIVTGILTEWATGSNDSAASSTNLSQSNVDISCCHQNDDAKAVNIGLDHSSQATSQTSSSVTAKFWSGLKYAMTDLLADIAVWTAVGVLAAAAIAMWFPPESLGDRGSGLVAMLVMMLVGIPMYICATASTPVAASLLLAGVSPGTVLVFLLAGPATNLGSVGIIAQEIGRRAVVVYLVGICLCSLCLGWTLDFGLLWTTDVMEPHTVDHRHLLPEWISLCTAVLLPLFALSRFAKKRIEGG